MIDEKVFIDELSKGINRTLAYSGRLAVKYSSGKYSRKKLAKMGHPYAVRNAGKLNSKGKLAVPYGDPAKINIQEGDFIISWHTKQSKKRGDIISGSLYNDDPASGKLERGIPRLTIPRPLIERVSTRTNYWYEKYMAEAVVKAISRMNQ